MKTIKQVNISILILILSFVAIINISNKDIEVKATETQNVELSIYRNNVAYSDKLNILYAVSYQNIDINTNKVQLLFFDSVQEQYIKGNESYVSYSEGTSTISGTKVLIFYSNGIAAKEMTEDIYAVAYVNINGVDYYSEVNKFSVLEYALKIKETSSNTLQVELVLAMLKYGSLAQQALNYNTNRLADATYYNINVVNGSLSDGFNQGRVKENEVITLTANTKEGYVFTNWTDSLGNIVSTDKDYSFTVTKSDIYTVNYIEEDKITNIGDIKLYENVIYGTEIDNINLPSILTYYHNGLNLTIPVSWEFEKYNPTVVGIQKIYASILDNTNLVENFIEVNNIYIEIEVLAYDLVLNEETNEYTIVSYYGDEEVVNIPETFDGKNISTISSYAFSDNLDIKEVNIPNTITKIEIEAFSFCDNIEKITIPFLGESLESSNNWFGYIFGALSYSENNNYLPLELNEVVILEGITSIANNCFANCSFLEEISLPEGLITIGEYAFNGCINLNEIIIPESVTNIKGYAFKNCKSFKNIVISDNVSSVGSYILSGCTSLESITISWIPGHLYSLFGSTGGYTSDINKNYVPKSLKEVIMTKGTYVNSYAFSGCSSIERIVLPEGVTYIDDYAFSGCSSLKEIVIPGSVTSMHQYAFNGCSSIEKVYYNGTIEDWCNITFENNNYSSPMYYGASIYMKNANNEFEEVTEITLPNTITTLGRSQFRGFKNVTKINLPSRLTEISSNLFKGCSSLEEIVLPSRLTTIGSDAFNSCTSLTNITIPSNVTSIGDSAFYNCTSLTNITIPSGVTTIGDSAFYNCTSLINITIPSEVTSIVSYAFYNCISLTNITISSSVTSIASSAFENCYNLREVYNESDLVFTPGSSNYGYIACYALKVVNKGVASYKNNATVYEYFTTEDGFKFLNFNNEYYLISYTGTDEVPTLPALVNGKTYKCQYMDSTLKNIKLSTDFTSIHNYMFQYCSHLESIEIPNSITNIGRYAFYNCTSLTNITIPSEVTSIDGWAFSGCKSLTNITIPSGVTSIGSSAFEGCRSLTIYCEAESQPSGWSSNWNYSNCPVVWGYNKE